MGEAAARFVPAYDDGRVVLYEGDTREVLQRPVNRDGFAVVLTDPPYAAWRYLTTLRDTGQLDLRADIEWQASVFEWVTEWYWHMRQHVRDGGASWVFCNVNYLGFYLRWARMAGWDWTRIFELADDEFVVYGGPKLAADAQARAAMALVDRNRYGHGKDVTMLRQLLRESPPGPVLDPFAGTGSTLFAARDERREAVGIELVSESCQSLVARLRA